MHVDVADGVVRGAVVAALRSSKLCCVLETVLRKMGRLDADSSLKTVDGVLSGRRLSARDFTTVLTALKARHAWQLALRVGEWMRLRSLHNAETLPWDGVAQRTTQLPNRAHYQVMLSACAASGAAAGARQLRTQMAAEGVGVDATFLSTLVFAHERGNEPQATIKLLDELEEMYPPGGVGRVTAKDAPADEAPPPPPLPEGSIYLCGRRRRRRCFPPAAIVGSASTGRASSAGRAHNRRAAAALCPTAQRRRHRPTALCVRFGDPRARGERRVEGRASALRAARRARCARRCALLLRGARRVPARCAGGARD